MAENKWKQMSNVLSRNGPFASSDFEPNLPKWKKFLLDDCRVLVIGAGGLGCELLKNLALMGFTNIDVIDMDTIDYSNLNRQFLFRKDDVGKSKAEVAAAFINKRVPGAKVVPHFKKIQDYPNDFYAQFNLVVAGLDSIEARRYINTVLIEMVDLDDEGNPDPDTIIPFIDGGTEGFKGQARLILPRITSCFECSLDAFPPQVNFPMCTLANTPRLPEHCIEYAKIVEWPKAFPNTKFDADNPEHMKWMFEASTKRANEFNIKGVTYRLTQGVVKNIIPAIASTNAIIAAAEANEAFKVATSAAATLDTYMMYNGLTGVYSFTFPYERKEGCPVCGNAEAVEEVDPNTKLEEFLDFLATNSKYQLKKPSIRTEGGKTLYMQGAMAENTKGNLPRPFSELIQDGEALDITDPSLPSVALHMKVHFKK